MALCSLETPAASDFSFVPGPISTGGPIARASEAVGGAGVPCAGRVLRGIRRGGCVRYCHELIGGCAEVSSAVVATPLAGTASIVVCGGANTWRGSGASYVFVAVGRCAGSVVRGRNDGWQGSRSSGWGAGGGGWGSATSVAVGIEASTPVGTASTVGCAGANTNGGGASHVIVVVGMEASTPACTPSIVVCAGANTKVT